MACRFARSWRVVGVWIRAFVACRGCVGGRGVGLNSAITRKGGRVAFGEYWGGGREIEYTRCLQTTRDLTGTIAGEHPASRSLLEVVITSQLVGAGSGVARQRAGCREVCGHLSNRAPYTCISTWKGFTSELDHRLCMVHCLHDGELLAPKGFERVGCEGAGQAQHPQVR